ncbi:MAG: hypothetical protein R3Y12_01320 [Clostridia bacterium]
MSENNFDFTVQSIISEIGIDTKIEEKPQKIEPSQQAKNAFRRENSGYNSNENLVYKKNTFYENLSRKLKKQALIAEKKTEFLTVLLIFSLYLSVATVFNLPLPSFFVFVDYPYIFVLTNIILHIFALIASVDIIIDGFEQIFMPNINTLVTFTTFFILAHTLSIVFLENSLGFLPYTPVAIFILQNAQKSERYLKRSKSYTYRICSMSTRLAFVSADKKLKSRFVFKNGTFNKENFASSIDKNEKSYFLFAYFWVFIIFSISFSIFIAKTDLNLFLWNLATISALSVPISYILGWSLPYKYTSKKLFMDGNAIKSYQDIKKMHKNNLIVLSDKDLFPDNTIFIEQMELFGNFSEDTIIAYTASGFAKINSCTRQTFEELMKNRYLQPYRCQKVDLIDENGFTFTVNNQKVSIGNAKFVTSLGLTVTNGLEYPNPIYVVTSSQIAAVFSMKYTVSPKMYNAISNLEQNSIKIKVSTLDFSINSKIIERLYDLPRKSILFDDFLERYSYLEGKKTLDESILLTRQTGNTYINAFLQARKLSKTVKINYIFGFFCSLFGLIIASYLVYNFTAILLLPHNILIFLYVWSIPTKIISFFYNNM